MCRVSYNTNARRRSKTIYLITKYYIGVYRCYRKMTTGIISEKLIFMSLFYSFFSGNNGVSEPISSIQGSLILRFFGWQIQWLAWLSQVEIQPESVHFIFLFFPLWLTDWLTECSILSWKPTRTHTIPFWWKCKYTFSCMVTMNYTHALFFSWFFFIVTVFFRTLIFQLILLENGMKSHAWEITWNTFQNI